MEILILTALVTVVIAVAAWSDKESEDDMMEFFYGVNPGDISEEQMMEHMEMMEVTEKPE